MALVLRLNRGATTINLNDGTNYRVLDTYLPRVATRKVSPFGGEPYNEVTEQIPLYIKGTTAAVVLEKLEDIIAALEQAYAWRLGAVVSPVLLEYLPHGTSLSTVVQAACLGTPAEASNLYEMAQFGMYMVGNSFETLITLPIVRKGLWLGEAETETQSTPVTNPGALEVTFSETLRIPSPVKLVFGDAGSYAAFDGTHAGFILVADTDDKIVIVDDPTVGGTVGSWDGISEPNATLGSYQAIDLTDGDQADGSGNFTINTDARLFALFASVFNGPNFTYTLKLRLGGDGFESAWTKPIALEPGAGSVPNTYPRIVFVGFIAVPASPTSVSIFVDGHGATDVPGNELGVDYVLVMAVDENTKAMAFSNVQNTTNRRMIDTTVDPQALTFPQPRLFYTFSSDPIDFAFRQGDLRPQSIGNTLTAWVIGTDPVNQNWRLVNSAGEIDFTLEATRYRGYLVVR